jgi:metal-sulfur cluster biosynthetic enzyme
MSMVDEAPDELDRTETLDAIRRELDTIGDPCSVASGVPMGLNEMGLVGDIDLDDRGHVVIDLRLTSPTCHMVGYFHVTTKQRVLQVRGVRSVEVRSDSGLDWTPDMMSADAKYRRMLALKARGLPVVG